MNNTTRYNNFTALYALQEVDESLAIEAISTPNLDGEELAHLLQDSMLGTFVSKKTGEALKFSTKVMQAGFINKFDQLHKKQLRHGT